mgnify:CR=1 FL=1
MSPPTSLNIGRAQGPPLHHYIIIKGQGNMRTLRLALSQINTTVGDLEGNARKIIEYIERARGLKVDIITFPELAITGYPPEDLVLKPQFIKSNLQQLQEVVKNSQGITVVVGFVDKDDDAHNAAALIHDGRLIAKYHKVYLPDYSVFDESRYFQPGRENFVFTINGATVGISICEDIWYPSGPPHLQALIGGAQLLINISSSPYYMGKKRQRREMLATRARDSLAIVAYNNLVGGQDELIFDGGSMILDQEGNLIAEGKQFEEELIMADLDLEAVFRARLHDPRRRKGRMLAGADKVQVINLPPIEGRGDRPSIPPREVRPLEPVEEVYKALVLGARDYVRKNGFEKVVIGLSGGIDSALTATIATDALGKDNVIGVSMPSQFSSKESRVDARRLARNLGIRLLTLPINGIFKSYLRGLRRSFAGLKEDVTEENIQARIRGNLLMALSNKFGWLVLTTGNKSETSVGYCTLYGDTAGGFAVIKDVPKTLVYDLARYRNDVAGRFLIPERILLKEPSAELRAGQRDTDSLPPYPILDPIIQAYVERDMGLEDMVAGGFDPEVAKKVISMVDANEYKRRQGPPGIKITPRSFGKDRRLPITNRFREF